VTVLTDYHTHLRPDDEETASAERYFTTANVDRYLAVAAERGIAELGFSEHVYRFRQALAIWRHPFWEGYAVDDLDAYCDFLVAMREAGRPIKLGLEVDWVPGREDRIADLIDGRPFDYVIGSVHFISDGAVDHEGYDAWQQASSDDVWRHYFRTLGEAASSGLFDILAHPDLVKVWGAGRPRPEREPRAFYELALEGIASSGVAVEVSTAGLRKPAGEIYPAPELLDLCLAAGSSVALSSDAHEPDHIGYAYESAVDFLREHGVETLSVFNGRIRREERLG
jgi:histidinol-phosphatase (PHP family)